MVRDLRGSRRGVYHSGELLNDSISFAVPARLREVIILHSECQSERRRLAALSADTAMCIYKKEEGAAQERKTTEVTIL